MQVQIDATVTEARVSGSSDPHLVVTFHYTVKGLSHLSTMHFRYNEENMKALHVGARVKITIEM